MGHVTDAKTCTVQQQCSSRTVQRQRGAGQMQCRQLSRGAWCDAVRASPMCNGSGTAKGRAKGKASRPATMMLQAPSTERLYLAPPPTAS